MNTLFSFVQKTLLATVILCFSFVTLYTPQITKVETAEAAARALESTQWVNSTLLAASKIVQTATNAFLSSLNTKEYILDPIAWVAAKTMIANTTNSVVSWINSGFHGAPMFVQDMKNYMQNINIDITKEFVDELGVAPYVTGPFRADIQSAFAKAFVYEVQTEAPRGVSVYDTSFDATLISMTETGSFGADSWDDWFKIVNEPQTYTPYGNLLAVQRESERRSQQAQENETNLLNFGDGFISNKVCATVTQTLGNTKQNCSVATPGQTISETLNVHLGSGINNLIAADEISEMLADLVVNLGHKAISGAAGILGLSGGTGYTEPTLSGLTIIDQMTQDQTDTNNNSVTDIKNLVDKDLALETKYENLAIAAQAAYNNIGLGTASINSTLTQITDAKNKLQAIKDSLDAGLPPAQAMNDYNAITPKHQEADLQSSADSWVYEMQDNMRSTHTALTSYNNQMTSLRNFFTQIVNNTIYPVCGAIITPYCRTQAQKDAAQAALNEINAERARIIPIIPKLSYDPDNPASGPGIAAAYMNGTITSSQALSQVATLDITPAGERGSNLAAWNTLRNQLN